ncbi:hypothetical protein NDU88_000165 [Pleurodeles waltl]|uniref:Uncharacterized protein n=1 Tax=Pleurodeles waltl TaxID=8319 RepID=A0AAV7S664_PLEWA|nr:hypothetical protein NDU88_000165 [Pleurodeles waltl]
MDLEWNPGGVSYRLSVCGSLTPTFLSHECVRGYFLPAGNRLGSVYLEPAAGVAEAGALCAVGVSIGRLATWSWVWLRHEHRAYRQRRAPLRQVQSDTCMASLSTRARGGGLTLASQFTPKDPRLPARRHFINYVT